MELRKLIEEYLEKAKAMQIATAVNNQPWVCTVYYTYDKSLDLFWISKPYRRHSQEIVKNHKIAGIVVLQHTPGARVQEIQFVGNAIEIKDEDEIKKAVHQYAKRFGLPLKRVHAILDGEDGHLCYKVTPESYVLFDEVNFPDNPRQEYKPGQG